MPTTYALILGAVVLIAALLALVLTPVTRHLAVMHGLVDRPDGRRKMHGFSIARVGGIPVILSYTIALWLLVVGAAYIPEVRPTLSTIWSILPAALVVFLTGLGDDIYDLKPLHKLAGQAVGALFAISAGVRITNIAGLNIPPLLGAGVTLIWLLACANAINLIDGVDGLASGIALLAAATSVIAAMLNNQFGLALATLPLVGALLGFLRYNFNPASIFLGDCGSLTLGFLLGCYSIAWGTKSATILGVTAPLMALVVPLLDTSLAIVGRFLRQQPIFEADRSHIHHRLLNRGFTPRRVALLLYAAGGLGGLLSLLLSRARGNWEGLVVILFVVLVFLAVQQLGYIEFGTARRLLLAGAFRGLLSSQIHLDHFRRQVRDASTPEECWALIRGTYSAFGFCSVRMQLGTETYRDGAEFDKWPLWVMRIPFHDAGYVELERFHHGSSKTAACASYAEAIQTALNEKLLDSLLRFAQAHSTSLRVTTVTSHPEAASLSDESRWLGVPADENAEPPRAMSASAN